MNVTPTHGLFLVAFVLLFAWRMYRRYRSHVGPQKVQPLRMGLRVGLLGLVTALMLISPISLLGREVLGLGIALGAMLGALSLSQTHFETREGRQWYTPNVYIGMAVTAALAARMVYRLIVLYPQIQAGTLPHGGSPSAQMSIPTLAVFGLVIGYYAIYNGGVLWRSRQLMEEAMGLLILAGAAWLALHIGLAGTSLRDVLARPMGEQAFRGLFSVLSITVFASLIYAFIHAPRTPLWVAPEGLRWALALLMLPALFLFLGSLGTVSVNPADAGTKREPARGILRITCHPMMNAFGLWAAIHILGTGELSALVFFGAFLVTAAIGMPSIDAKFARRDPLRWQRMAAETSILPGGAILGQRNRLVWGEIGWVVPLLSLVLWVALLVLHRRFFGVAPVPLPWA